MSILLNPELEDRIAARMQSGGYSSSEDVIQAGIELLEARDAKPHDISHESTMMATRPIWEIAAAIMKEVPAEEWEEVPTDLARNHKHYLYGAPLKDVKPSR